MVAGNKWVRENSLRGRIYADKCYGAILHFCLERLTAYALINTSTLSVHLPRTKVGTYLGR